MKIESESFADGAAIPVRHAFGKHHPEQHVELSDNASPPLSWSDLPAGTKSLALLCHDPDVPSVGDDVNREGKRVPADLPRVDFFHLVLVDVPPDAAPFAEGELGRGVTPRGKAGPSAPRGYRWGLNDYTGWFSGDADMKGDYFGYDGPCPPWNDTIVHHYHFTLYALDIARCPVEGSFTGADVRAAIAGHVLGQASIVGTYTIAPDATDRG